MKENNNSSSLANSPKKHNRLRPKVSGDSLTVARETAKSRNFTFKKLRSKSITSENMESNYEEKSTNFKTNLKSYLNVQPKGSNNSVKSLKSISTNPNKKDLSKQKSFLPNNEISFKERNLIRKVTRNYSNVDPNNRSITSHKGDDISNHANYKSCASSEHSNIKLLKQLMNTSPYHQVPKAVRFSLMMNNEINSNFLPSLKPHSVNKNGAQFKNVLKGSSTILLKKTNPKESVMKRLLRQSSEVSGNLKKSIKIKNITWLIKNKTRHVHKLIDSYKNLRWFLDSKDNSMSKHLFEELITLINVPRDPTFVKTIFLIFDDEKADFVNIKQVLASLIFFSQGSYADKVTKIAELCVARESHVDLALFILYMKNMIFFKRDSRKLLEILKANFEDNLANLKVFKDFLLSNQLVKQIISKSFDSVQEAESYYEEELNTRARINLQKTKMNSVTENGNYCLNDYSKFDKILAIKQNVTNDNFSVNMKRTRISRWASSNMILSLRMINSQ